MRGVMRKNRKRLERRTVKNNKQKVEKWKGKRGKEIKW